MCTVYIYVLHIYIMFHYLTSYSIIYMTKWALYISSIYIVPLYNIRVCTVHRLNVMFHYIKSQSVHCTWECSTVEVYLNQKIFKCMIQINDSWILGKLGETNILNLSLIISIGTEKVQENLIFSSTYLYNLI